MKKLVIMAVAAVIIVASCSSLKYYPVPEFKNYSETIDLPGMNAGIIFARSRFWLQEEMANNGAYFYGKSPTLYESLLRIYSGGDRNWFGFHIENEQCRLTFYRHENIGNEFFAYKESEAREDAIALMNAQKALAARYRAYITAPHVSSLSEEEIDTLIAKGDEAYDNNQFSEAANFYSEALLADPTDIYTLIANGLCFQQLSESSRRVERFVLDTNGVISSYESKLNNMARYPTNWSLYYYNIDDSYNAECSRLSNAYKADTENLDRAIEMYITALSIEPDSETALSCAEYVKQKKAYISSRYSQLRTVLNNIKSSVDPIKEQLKEQGEAQQWANLTQSLYQLAQSFAQIQQNQSGYSGGGYSGGGQAGTASNGGSSGSDSQCYTCKGTGNCRDCGGSGNCRVCKGEKNLIYKNTGRYVGEKSDTLDKCAVCKGTGNCGNCRGTGKCPTCKGRR